MQQSKKLVQLWYFSGALLVFLILIVGGITRLTQSGLSIVEWKPLTGIIPPLNETEWLKEFDNYRQFPEYQQINQGMNLSEFKFIFFWEYLHRVLARLIGLVFLIPFIWFLVKKQLDSVQIKRALLLFGLGFLQGFMGWFMVSSGLIDVPYVSPYRLTMHLMLAFAIFGACLWFGLDIENRLVKIYPQSKKLKNWLLALGAVLLVQISWGALVAGHKAGYFYNTFPKMQQYWIPPEVWIQEPAIINLFNNPVMVQFMHRLLGTILLVMAVIFAIRIFKNPQHLSPKLKLLVISFLSLIAIQYLSGVFTLIYFVPVWLGVFHQSCAMILFGVLIWMYHSVSRSARNLAAS